VYALASTVGEVCNNYYPELMGAMYYINAPMMFRGVWAILKNFLDEKTRAKI